MFADLSKETKEHLAELKTYLVEWTETRRCFVRVEAESREMAAGEVSVFGPTMDDVVIETRLVAIHSCEEDV